MFAAVVAKQPQATVRLHDDQIEVQQLTNAIAEYILEKGYNYKVERVESTIKEIRTHLINGDIDLTLELWLENNLVWYQNSMDQGIIKDLGKLYSGGKQYWIVSRWYADSHNIRTIFDMKNHWQDFLDPDDPSKGIFFNCIYGWTCRDINKVKLHAYGLDRYYNTVSPVSPESLKSIYRNAGKMRIPVFGYYWEPNSIMLTDNWKILEEPPYSREIWKKVITSAEDPSATTLQQACAYNDTGAHKVASRNFYKKHPELIEMFSKMTINMDHFNAIFLRNNKEKRTPSSFRNFALEYLESHPDQWRSWVPGEIADRIEKNLIKDGHTATGD